MGGRLVGVALNVFWIVDNGSSHHSTKAADRIRERWPTATVVDLPIHASWLNQIEIYFSIVQRSVLAPNDFRDLSDVEERLIAFQDLYNLAARPFNTNSPLRGMAPKRGLSEEGDPDREWRNTRDNGPIGWPRPVIEAVPGLAQCHVTEMGSGEFVLGGWQRPRGRRRVLGLYRAVVLTLFLLRQDNSTLRWRSLMCRLVWLQF